MERVRSVIECVGCDRTVIRLWKKPMSLCVNDNEEHECGMGVDVNDTIHTGRDMNVYLQQNN
jgi:hypothetical protein